MRALIQIRPAQPADAEIAAVLLYSAYTHTSITFPLQEEHERALIERLEHFFRQDGNRFSYQHRCRCSSYGAVRARDDDRVAIGITQPALPMVRAALAAGRVAVAR
jgi:hypothetical protein